jgi:hypothetical protein
MFVFPSKSNVQESAQGIKRRNTPRTFFAHCEGNAIGGDWAIAEDSSSGMKTALERIFDRDT